VHPFDAIRIVQCPSRAFVFWLLHCPVLTHSGNAKSNGLS
jgi:hypothetical protein